MCPEPEVPGRGGVGRRLTVPRRGVVLGEGRSVPWRPMRWRSVVALVAAAGATMSIAAPVLAHGDHDARPLARDLGAGPHVISLWQVYPDAGDTMAPHLIVMFDGVPATPADAVVAVAVDGQPVE